jgi:hypothetical protein
VSVCGFRYEGKEILPKIPSAPCQAQRVQPIIPILEGRRSVRLIQPGAISSMSGCGSSVSRISSTSSSSLPDAAVACRCLAEMLLHLAQPSLPGSRKASNYVKQKGNMRSTGTVPERVLGLSRKPFVRVLCLL